MPMWRLLCSLSLGLVLNGSVLAEPLPKRDALLPADALRRFGEVQFRHPGGIKGSALSPDGKWLATSGWRSVVVWDVATQLPVHCFDIDSKPRYSNPILAFSANSRMLAVCPGREEIFVWDIRKGQLSKRLEANSRQGESFAFVGFTERDRSLVLSRNSTTEVYDLATWTLRRTIEMSPQLLSPTGTLVGMGRDEARIKLVDATTGNSTHQLNAQSLQYVPTHYTTFSPNGKTLAIYRNRGDIEIWSTSESEAVQNIKTPSFSSCQQLTFSRDGKDIFMGSSVGVFRWNAATGEEVAKWERKFDSSSGRLNGLHALPNSDALLACSEDGAIYRYDWKTEKESPTSGYVGQLISDLTPDGRFLALADQTGRAEVWNTVTGQRLATIPKEAATINTIAIAADGKTVAVGEYPGDVKIWDVVKNELRQRIRLFSQTTTNADPLGASALRFSPDGQTLLVDVMSGPTQAWHVDTGKMRWSQPQGNKHAYHPNGKHFATAYRELAIGINDLNTGKMLREIQLKTTSRQARATALAFSPDERWLVVAVTDRTLRFCNPETGVELAQIEAVDVPSESRDRLMLRRGWGIEQLAFSPNGKWLVTAGMDKTVRVWDVATQHELHRLSGHVLPVTNVGFGPSGKTLITSSTDGTAYQWNLQPRERYQGTTPWDDLGGTPTLAYQALWALVDEPTEAVKLLRAEQPPIQTVPSEKILNWISDLDSSRFATRELAAKALTDLERLALPLLKEAQTKSTSPEIRVRAGKLLERLHDDPTGDERRRSNAVHALELADTPETKNLLHEWAKGAAGARLTEEAKAALLRVR
jgi:WD40 repeat protein